ncbi:MAG: hypothetical protein AAGU32_13910 [Bacillota bacterium]
MSMFPRRRKPSFKVPNRLIQDGALSFSARRVGAVLYSRRSRLGACKRSLAYLARLRSVYILCWVKIAYLVCLASLHVFGYLPFYWRH